MRRRRIAILGGALGGAVLITAAGSASGCTVQLSALSASPNAGPALTTIQVEGEGVAGSSAVELRWDGEPGKVLARASADASGHFAASVMVPSATPGIHVITAHSSGAGAGRTVFDVAGAGAGPAAPAPDPWTAAGAPQVAAGSQGSFTTNVGAALLATGLVGLAGGFGVAGLRRRWVTSRS
jgi:hypothetical protein